jgi:hypothetical protein
VPRIEFFYIEDCPSHDRALEILREVLAEAHIQDLVEVTEIKTEQEARQYQFYGSPTIRIDGQDIAPRPEGIPEPSLACRAFQRADGRISPLPPRELIVAVLQRVSRGEK